MLTTHLRLFLISSAALLTLAGGLSDVYEKELPLAKIVGEVEDAEEDEREHTLVHASGTVIDVVLCDSTAPEVATVDLPIASGPPHQRGPPNRGI